MFLKPRNTVSKTMISQITSSILCIVCPVLVSILSIDKITRVIQVIPKGIILNKHNIDNQTLTYHFEFIFKGDQYINNSTYANLALKY